MKFKRLHPDAILPTYNTSLDSGMDFYSVETVYIESGETKLVETGWACKLPDPFNISLYTLGKPDHKTVIPELVLRPRSGLSLKTKLRIANSPATIDNGYTGPLKVICENIGNTPIVIEKDDKFVQGVINLIIQSQPEEVDELPNTDRGDRGFGSSGTK